MGVNKVILVGNLGRDPETRVTSGQVSVANFSIATNERRKDASGNWADHTEWHRVVCFGKLAEFATNYLKKGKQVYVEGRLRTNKWQDKDGNDRYTTEIIAASVQFVGARESEGGYTPGDSAPSPGQTAAVMNGLQSADAIESGPPAEASFDDDDIPF